MSTVGYSCGISCESYGQWTSPTLENSFGVDIGDESGWKVTGPNSSGVTITLWKNPHLGSAITPYIPSENDEAFVAKCQEVFDKKLQPGETPLTAQEAFFLKQICAIVIPFLSPSNLARFSLVDKCSYAAAKQFVKTQGDAYWNGALKQNFSHVQFIDSKLCAFSPEDQYKIFVKRIAEERKPYIAEYNRNLEKTNNTIEGIKTAQNELVQKIGQTKAFSITATMRQVLQPGTPTSGKQTYINALWETETREVYFIGTKVMELMMGLKFLAGWEYKGVNTPISPDSLQGKLAHTITVVLPESFNNQEEFEKVIRKSETLKNTISSSNAMEVSDAVNS